MKKIIALLLALVLVLGLAACGAPAAPAAPEAPKTDAPAEVKAEAPAEEKKEEEKKSENVTTFDAIDRKATIRLTDENLQKDFCKLRQSFISRSNGLLFCHNDILLYVF